jgi:hypothetical protein
MPEIRTYYVEVKARGDRRFNQAVRKATGPSACLRRLELDGEDLQHEPIEVRKTTLIAYGSLDRHVGMSRGDARERDRCSAR